MEPTSHYSTLFIVFRCLSHFYNIPTPLIDFSFIIPRLLPRNAASTTTGTRNRHAVLLLQRRSTVIQFIALYEARLPSQHSFVSCFLKLHIGEVGVPRSCKTVDNALSICFTSSWTEVRSPQVGMNLPVSHHTRHRTHDHDFRNKLLCTALF